MDAKTTGFRPFTVAGKDYEAACERLKREHGLTDDELELWEAEGADERGEFHPPPS